MHKSTTFDLWADGYDRSVGLSDEAYTYPFAGYKNALAKVYQLIMTGPHETVLDIGFGTGVLTKKLYDSGCSIFGQDFSPSMLAIAQEKMPHAALYPGDFAHGLCAELSGRTYDAICMTYALHHLPDGDKIASLQSLLPLLRPGGSVIVADIAFATREKWEACRASAGDDWDEDEFYLIAEEIKNALPELTFERISHCAGVLTLAKPTPDENLLGKCGFYCGACPTYRKGGCPGCEAAHATGDCFTRDCVKEKQLPFCGACEQFPCDTILTKPRSTVLDRDWLAWKKRSGRNG